MNGKPALMPVAEALARILDGARPLSAHETVPLDKAFGRTLARDLVSMRTQPPMDVSAMDGYALRAADVADGRRAKLVGESAAGSGYGRPLAPGEAVRIFTGAPVPDGTDTILIQEDATVSDGLLSAAEPLRAGRHIRATGLDFRDGVVGLPKGTRLGPSEIAMAAAMNHAAVDVVKRPRVAILASGDELVSPGQTPGPDQIVCSNPYAVSAYAEGAGGEPVYLGIATDDFASLESSIARARDLGADVLVTLGGASVGDHDLVQSALTKQGMSLGFWKIAMRPGKPLIHGSLGSMSILGLPGNPVSSILCSLIFLVPLIRKLSGDPDPAPDMSEPAILGCGVKANDVRADYLRAALSRDASGRLVATPHEMQDSSMLSVITQSQALVLRAAFAPAAKAGDEVRVIRLSKGGF